MTGRKETPSIPEEGWTPPAWLKPFSKLELAWLCQQLHDRNARLQIENRQHRTQWDCSTTLTSQLPSYAHAPATPAQQHEETRP